MVTVADPVRVRLLQSPGDMFVVPLLTLREQPLAAFQDEQPVGLPVAAGEGGPSLASGSTIAGAKVVGTGEQQPAGNVAPLSTRMCAGCPCASGFAVSDLS